MIPTLLRLVAFGIAVLGVIDPAITSARRIRPEVAVVATDPSFTDLADQISDRLAERFTVIPAPFASAAATIIAGNSLPSASVDIAGPAFVVTPAPAALSIEAVETPAHVSLSTRTPVTVVVRARGLKGKDLQAGLQLDGVFLERTTRSIAAEDEQIRLPLQFVPAVPGATLLHVTTEIEGDAATADVVVDVRRQQHGILFFDARPSWLSTFVRRAIEVDPRFVVSSRTLTSRSISVDAGTPPAAFSDRAALTRYDVVVVGAPELLSASEVDALEYFLRRRGGAVVMLPDNNARGPVDRILGVQRWTTPPRAHPVAIGDSLKLRAGSVLVPEPLPRGAIPIAKDSLQAPVVWETAVGAGRLIVSGALDAWRFRDPAQSQFEAFWRELLAAAGSFAIPPISIDIPEQPLAPGATASFTAIVREFALGERISDSLDHNAVSAALVTGEARIPVRLYPDGSPGRVSGRLQVPDSAGSYALVVTARGATAETPLVVARHTRAKRDRTELLTLWATSHDGRLIPASQLDQLAPALEDVIRAELRRERWYPLRSAWWIFPFTLLLAAEWWSRRRRGLS